MHLKAIDQYKVLTILPIYQAFYSYSRKWYYVLDNSINYFADNYLSLRLSNVQHLEYLGFLKQSTSVVNSTIQLYNKTRIHTLKITEIQCYLFVSSGRSTRFLNMHQSPISNYTFIRFVSIRKSVGQYIEKSLQVGNIFFQLCSYEANNRKFEIDIHAFLIKMNTLAHFELEHQLFRK